VIKEFKISGNGKKLSERQNPMKGSKLYQLDPKLTELERHHQEKRSSTQIRIDLSMIPTHKNKDGTKYESVMYDTNPHRESSPNLEQEKESTINRGSTISEMQIKENLKLMELQLLTSPRTG
jgi:hypothetical protein